MSELKEFFDNMAKTYQDIFDGKLYAFTKKELCRMCREYRVQTYLGENSNDEAWIEYYIEKLNKERDGENRE